MNAPDLVSAFAGQLAAATPIGLKAQAFEPLTVEADAIPAALKGVPRWLTWRLEERRPGKPSKIPYDAKTGRWAKGTNWCDAWATFDESLAAYRRGGYAGLGFVFDGTDRIVGIDFDDCRQTDDTLCPWAARILELLGRPYAEISPSGTGVKAFVYADLAFPGGKNGKNFGQVEMYRAGRWFAVTGRKTPESDGEIVERTNEAEALLSACFRTFGKPEALTSPAAPIASEAAVDDVIQRAVKYLNKLPAAVSGSRGHDRTMCAARAMVWGFDLGPDVGYELLAAHFNGRCKPPWSEAELRHKCQDAHVKPFNKPRGYLRDAVRPGLNGARADYAEDLAYRPFPVDALPEPIRSFVDAGAQAIGCDPSYLALTLLAEIAAAIGDTRRLELKRGWSAPAILWGAIVGESGTAKSPAFKLALGPVRDRQSRASKVFDAEQQKYELAMEVWQEAKKGARGEKPQPPTQKRFVVSDTTVEALAPILLANPRGLLLARDELAGWFGSFDRYAGKGKTGADSANWLSMFDAENIIVDRKTGNPRTIHVPQALVCVIGGIQPAILRRALGQEHRESGLAARLLLTCPPRRTKRWTEADIDPKAEAELVQMFDRLYELQLAVGDDGKARPALVRLSADAKAVWIAYYNAHSDEQADLTGDLAAAWSKLEEYAARLALVVHFIRWAAADPNLSTPEILDAASMNAGIALATWFKHEARRVYAMLGESDEHADRRRLTDWIDRKGRVVTPRDVQQGCRWLKEPGQAEAALEELVTAGVGTWRASRSGANGGRPTQAFVLSTPVAVHETPVVPEETQGSVDVDSVDDPEDASPATCP